MNIISGQTANGEQLMARVRYLWVYICNASTPFIAFLWKASFLKIPCTSLTSTNNTIRFHALRHFHKHVTLHLQPFQLPHSKVTSFSHSTITFTKFTNINKRRTFVFQNFEKSLVSSDSPKPIKSSHPCSFPWADRIRLN